MFLFILESIGTSELILVGIVALIFLGPRKLPEYAKKIGKITSEFRGTANEFKDTWQREVNFDEEVKALRIDELDREPLSGVQAIGSVGSTGAEPLEQSFDILSAPSIRQLDPDEVEKLKMKAGQPSEKAVTPVNDKKNWL